MSNVTTASYFKTAKEFQYAANRLYDQVQGYNAKSSYDLFDFGTDLNFLAFDVSELSGNTAAPASDNAYKQP